jgi:hypothetical protein
LAAHFARLILLIEAVGTNALALCEAPILGTLGAVSFIGSTAIDAALMAVLTIPTILVDAVLTDALAC